MEMPASPDSKGWHWAQKMPSEQVFYPISTSSPFIMRPLSCPISRQATGPQTAAVWLERGQSQSSWVADEQPCPTCTPSRLSAKAQGDSPSLPQTLCALGEGADSARRSQLQPHAPMVHVCHRCESQLDHSTHELESLGAVGSCKGHSYQCRATRS